MSSVIVTVITAFASGVLGTSLGAVAAVIMTAVVALVGIGANIAGADFNLVSGVAFGMFLGPQVSFGPACCAAAYAKKKGYLADSHDVFTPLITTHRADVLIVGGLFAVFGWYLNTAIASVANGGIDSVALTVTIISLVAKVLFGGSLIGTVEGGGKRFAIDSPCWLEWQTSRRGFVMLLTGGTIGAISGYLVIAMCGMAAETGNEALAAMSTLPVWAVAVILFMFMGTGRNIPVFHHIGLPAAYAAKMAVDAGAGEDALLWAVAFGILGCYMGDWTAKLFDVNGDGYVDPPSATIAILSLFPLAVFPAIGVNVPGTAGYYAVPILVIALLVVYALKCEKEAKRLNHSDAGAAPEV